MSVAEKSRPYTAFTVPGRGSFQFKILPFGLHNAAASCHCLIDQVVNSELEPNVYLDEIVIVTQLFEDHLSLLGV